jgi:predicted DNA-binding transcriptional regulator AlpA
MPQVEQKFLTTKEAANRMRLSESALEKKRVDGTGPVFVKLGKSVRYEIAALDDWISAGRHKSTGIPLNATAATSTEAQLHFIDDFRAAGGHAVVAEGLDRALRTLEAWKLLRGVAS